VLTVDLFVGERDKQASATGEHVRSCKHALLPAPTLLRRRSRINQCTHCTQNIQPNLLLTAFLPVLLFAGAIALDVPLDTGPARCERGCTQRRLTAPCAPRCGRRTA